MTANTRCDLYATPVIFLQRYQDFIFRPATDTYVETPCGLYFVQSEDQMSDHAYIVRQEARLLGGSVSDWLVLVGGVLLAGFVAAMIAL
jgi:hypothetical protein